MKTKIIKLIATALAITMAACTPIEPDPVNPAPIEEPEDPVNQESEKVEFTLEIQNTGNRILYPSEEAGSVEVPFSVKADKDIPGLTITTENSLGITSEIKMNDTVSGVISITGTRGFTKNTGEVKVTAKSDDFTKEKTIQIEKAYIRPGMSSLVFSSSMGNKTFSIYSNIEYLIEPDEDFKQFASLNFNGDEISISVSENYNATEHSGYIVLKDKNGFLDNIKVKVIQTGIETSRLTDSLALVDLYNALNMGAVPAYKDWLTEKPMNKWYGVEVYNERVTNLSIILYEDKPDTWEYNKYEIPETIGNLDNLEYLKIEASINGEIPRSIGNLKKLRELYLTSNPCYDWNREGFDRYLIGQGYVVPESTLSKLHGNLQNHPLKDIIKNLKDFYLNGRFQGGIPEWMAENKFPRIESSAFDGRIPDALMNSKYFGENKWSIGDPEYPSRFIYHYDYVIIKNCIYYNCAVWYGTEQPEGVKKIPGEFGEHWTWESEEAMFNFFKNVSGYDEEMMQNLRDKAANKFNQKENEETVVI